MTPLKETHTAEGSTYEFGRNGQLHDVVSSAVRAVVDAGVKSGIPGTAIVDTTSDDSTAKFFCKVHIELTLNPKYKGEAELPERG